MRGVYLESRQLLQRARNAAVIQVPQAQPLYQVAVQLDCTCGRGGAGGTQGQGRSAGRVQGKAERGARCAAALARSGVVQPRYSIWHAKRRNGRGTPKTNNSHWAGRRIRLADLAGLCLGQQGAQGRGGALLTHGFDPEASSLVMRRATSSRVVASMRPFTRRASSSLVGRSSRTCGRGGDAGGVECMCVCVGGGGGRRGSRKPVQHGANARSTGAVVVAATDASATGCTG